MNAEKIIQEKSGTIVDVRTPAEFQGGNVAGSINIPMQEITSRIDEVKSLPPISIMLCFGKQKWTSA
jgi:phage shock protein E